MIWCVNGKYVLRYFLSASKFDNSLQHRFLINVKIIPTYRFQPAEFFVRMARTLFSSHSAQQIKLAGVIALLAVIAFLVGYFIQIPKTIPLQENPASLGAMEIPQD